jgi:hypothetical protein
MVFQNDRNNDDNNNNCPNCGSNETESGDTHEHCSNCGIPRETLELDPGFVPTNPNPGAGADGELGGAIGPTNDPFYRRLDRLQRRTTHSGPDFIDGIVRELSDSEVGLVAVRAATRIIEAANVEENLGRKRHSLRGTPGISKDDDRQYRQRIYAAASLLILFKHRQENSVHSLIAEWQLAKNDVLKVKKMLWALVRSKLSWLTNANDDDVRARAQEITLYLTTLRDHLAAMEDRATAFVVYEAAQEIARQMGEPVSEGDVQLHTDNPVPTTDLPPGAAAGRAFFEAMMQLGLSREIIRELHAATGFFNLDSFVDRIGSQRRADDAGEEA